MKGYLPILKRRQEMLNLKLAGMSYQTIGERFGISRQRVQQLLQAPKEIRAIVIKRAGGKCERCGIHVGMMGHVHHRGNNDFDYEDVDNLQLLCPSCHLQTHHEIGLEKTKHGIPLTVTTIEVSRALKEELDTIKGDLSYEKLIRSLLETYKCYS